MTEGSEKTKGEDGVYVRGRATMLVREVGPIGHQPSRTCSYPFPHTTPRWRLLKTPEIKLRIIKDRQELCQVLEAEYDVGGADHIMR